jgi:hypothetical protein
MDGCSKDERFDDECNAEVSPVESRACFDYEPARDISAEVFSSIRSKILSANTAFRPPNTKLTVDLEELTVVWPDHKT